MKKTLIALALGVMVGCSQQSSQEHIDSAREYIEQQNLEAAVVELKNAVQKEPQSGLARFELGKVYVMTRQFESAEKELNRALEYGHPSTEVIPLLSQAYQQTGAHAALTELEHDNQGLSPTAEAKVAYYKLRSLVQLGKNEEAAELVSRVTELDTESVYKGMGLVFTPILERNYELALLQVNELKAQAPLNADLLKLQGQLMLQNNAPVDAVEVYQEYIKQYPDDYQTLFLLSRLLVESDRGEEAEPYVDQLLKLSSENGYLNQYKAMILAKKEDFENAQVYAEQAIQFGRSVPEVRLVAGFAAYQNGDYESSNRHLSFVASSLPGTHPALRMLAASQLQLGMGTEASDVLERIDNVSEQDALLFSKAGYELIRSGEIKQAQELVEKTSALSATADDLTRLGILKLSLNDVGGIVNLEQALEQAPQLENAKSTLATAYLATDQLDKAAALAATWKSEAPQDPKAYMLAGEVLLKQKDFNAARTEFETILGFDPEYSLAKLALANIEVQQGQAEKALERLQTLLDQQPEYIPGLATFYLIQKQRQQSQAGLAPALKALELAPENGELRVLVARIQGSERAWPESLAVLEPIAADENAPGGFFEMKGQALLNNAMYVEAETHYDKWLELSPNNRLAVMGKLLLLDGQNKFQDGLALTESFLEKRDDLRMAMLRTHFLLMTGQFPPAREAFDALPDEAKALPISQGFQARLALSENAFEKALPFARAAYENLPNSRNLVVLMTALDRSERTDETFDLLSSHNERFPQDVTAQMLLAERQIEKSQDSAIATYEESLKVNPNNYVVLNNLAYLYLQEKRLEEAEELARRAVEIRPENAAALDTLAQILVASQDYEEALRFYDRAITDDMRNEEIFLNYVETLFAADQKRLALRKLEQREMTSEASKKRVAELKSKYGS